MNPGRELDALVAENVMGWEFVRHGVGSFDSGHWERDGQRAHISSTKNPLPHYSTDIAAAWEVVEKMDLLEENHLWRDKDGWVVGIEDLETGREWTTRGKTPSHAICLAALKAIESKA